MNTFVPLVRKLGIKAGTQWRLFNSPQGFVDNLDLETVPNEYLLDEPGPFDGVIIFATSLEEFKPVFMQCLNWMPRMGVMWIAWPKKSSNLPTDMNFDIVQSTALTYRLVDNKVCAIDETWTALRFVVPVACRSKWPDPGTRS